MFQIMILLRGTPNYNECSAVLKIGEAALTVGVQKLCRQHRRPPPTERYLHLQSVHRALTENTGVIKLARRSAVKANFERGEGSKSNIEARNIKSTDGRSWSC